MASVMITMAVKGLADGRGQSDVWHIMANDRPQAIDFSRAFCNEKVAGTWELSVLICDDGEICAECLQSYRRWLVDYRTSQAKPEMEEK